MDGSRVEQPLPPPMRLARISVDRYHRMLETGVLEDAEPIELLNGLLVLKDRSAVGGAAMTVGKRHAAAVHRLGQLDARLSRLGCHIRIQNRVTFPPGDEPEPDGAIVRGMDTDYLDRHPGAGDIACVFEVADSSLTQDRTTKLAVYAATGVPCYAIVNLVDRQVEFHEQPCVAESRYARSSVLAPGATLTITLPGASFAVSVADLLP